MTKLKEGNVGAASELFQVEEFLRFEEINKQHWSFWRKLLITT